MLEGEGIPTMRYVESSPQHDGSKLNGNGGITVPKPYLGLLTERQVIDIQIEAVPVYL